MTSTRASRIQGGAGQLLQLRIPSPTKLDRRQTPASARRCPGTTYTAAALLTQPHPHISCRVPTRSSQVRSCTFWDRQRRRPSMGRADASDVKGWCLPTGSWGVLLDGLGGHCIPRVGFWHGGGGDPRYPRGIRWWASSMVERHATRPEALLSSEGCGKRGRVYISASSPGGYCFAI